MCKNFQSLKINFRTRQWSKKIGLTLYSVAVVSVAGIELLQSVVSRHRVGRHVERCTAHRLVFLLLFYSRLFGHFTGLHLNLLLGFYWLFCNVVTLRPFYKQRPKSMLRQNSFLTSNLSWLTWRAIAAVLPLWQSVYHRCKKTFFFYFWHVFTFYNVFFIFFQRFFLFFLKPCIDSPIKKFEKHF